MIPCSRESGNLDFVVHNINNYIDKHFEAKCSNNHASVAMSVKKSVGMSIKKKTVATKSTKYGDFATLHSGDSNFGSDILYSQGIAYRTNVIVRKHLSTNGTGI